MIMKFSKLKKILLTLLAAVICAFFITDTLRAKIFGAEPLFCIKAIEFDDGFSAEYFGAGYKIKKDHDITDGSEEYFVTLWLLPDSISL